MVSSPAHIRFIVHEVRSLSTRLEQVRPFALNMPSVPAAALAPRAQLAVESHLRQAKRELRAMIQGFLAWLAGPGRSAPAPEAQRRFTVLRLKFNAMLDELDIFADVISQRSEHDAGTWVSGLDAVAADALAIPRFFESPVIVCYLDRGHGAAIRRARTRLPGGRPSPIGVVRIPRERMVGTSVASSLCHEVGHQAAELLRLVPSLRPVLREREARAGTDAAAWRLLNAWISEILADLFAVARVGIGGTVGLIGVVSLPTYFVFRINDDDPHPSPWIRVLLSAAMGRALYPDPQWNRLAALWRSLYPVDRIGPKGRPLYAVLERVLPAFVELLLNHRPATMNGAPLRAWASADREAGRLRLLFQSWLKRPLVLRDASPSLVLAVICQGRADGQLSAAEENRILAGFLTSWALRNTFAANPSLIAQQVTGTATPTGTRVPQFAGVPA